MKNKFAIIIGVLITFAYLGINLLIINDYGLSWDFHYHHYAGLYHLGLPVPKISDQAPVPFTPPDPRLTTEDPFGPFTQIIPTLSHIFFYQKLNLLPQDSAYNLPMVIFGSLGVGVLYFFLFQMFGFYEAIIGSLFLALLPNYFGYLHNDMKDIANAFAFTLSLYLFWRLVKNRKLIDLFWAVSAFAFAFNVKINSVMIPVVCLIWIILIYLKRYIVNVKRFSLSYIILYFILSPLAAILLWWPFWRNPLAKLLELPYFYSHNTLNMPVLFTGRIFHSGVNTPWFYPIVYLVITTPPVIFLSFFVGLTISIYYVINFYHKGYEMNKINYYLFLLIWFFIPLLRYLSPKSGAIDGVRHFMEVVYPMSAIGAIGWVSMIRWLRNRLAKTAIVILHVIVIIGLIKNIVIFHPYQTSYFSPLIGGISGAQGKYDIDFWGTPQKEAILWLNKNAPKNSVVNVVMAQSSTAVYARSDLLNNLNTKDIWTSDYVVLLNKQSFFNLYPVVEYLNLRIKEKKNVYTKKIDGVPLVWVFKN